MTSNRVLKIVQNLKTQLQAAAAENLVALIAFGDFARPGEFDPELSELNLLLVLNDLSTTGLDAIIPAVTEARRQQRLSVMTMTIDDLKQSCDVFPVRFVDMQEHHRLICGTDVLKDLSISDDHLRLRCEQELKNLMIRLRFTYLRCEGEKHQLRAAMMDSVKHVLRLLSIALTLKTGFAPGDDNDVLHSTEEEFGFSTDVLQQVLSARRLRQELSDADVFNRYMTAVQAAASAVDQLDVPAP